jgi:CRISPR/Cas system CMR-associated protein Cmr3 (group 5 of RAMP superfamily)
MSQCPYPETFTNPISGKTESNSLYLAWHCGYEAHKFEMANQSIRIANLALELETEIINIKELKRALVKQKDKLQGEN